MLSTKGIWPIFAQPNAIPVLPNGESAIEESVGADANLAQEVASNIVEHGVFKTIYDAMADFTNTVLEAISTYWMKLSVAPIFAPGSSSFGVLGKQW